MSGQTDGKAKKTMKLAASDYDGSLFVRGEVSHGDLKAIDEWRARGHLFAIATGRDLNLIRHEIKARLIPVDYLICNTGASLYDAGLNLLQTRELPGRAAETLLKHPLAAASRYILFSGSDATYLDMRAEESWLTSLKLPLTPVSAEEAAHLSGLQQIGLEYDSAEAARQSARALNESLKPDMQAHQCGLCVDIVAAGIDKATGLAALSRLIGPGDAEILPIGDSENDLPMIRRFSGYAVGGASEAIKKESRGVYESVGDMRRAHLDD
jgi:HAD superfamily hydrolase (TIGR01484 family)